MPLTLVFPADRPGSATYASLAAQVEAGLVRVVQDRRCHHDERRSGEDRRQRQGVREHGGRAAQRRHAYPQRRQAVPLPVGLRIIVTP